MGFFSNLSTKWKLISGFLVVAAITAMVGETAQVPPATAVGG